MKSKFLSLFFCFGAGFLFAQNHLDVSLGGNFTTSTFPDFEIEGMPNLETQGRFNIIGAISYQRQIKPKFALGLGLQVAPRSFHVGVNKESLSNPKGGGFQYLYMGLVPQMAYTPVPKWTFNLGLPTSYLIRTRYYDSGAEKWIKPSDVLTDSQNRIDFGLQPGIQFNATDRFALNLEAYYGITPVQEGLAITDSNGASEKAKDRNLGLSLSLKHRLF